MNVLLLGNTMSLWFLVVGLSFFTNPTGLLRFPAHLHHICWEGGCLLYNVNMYNPTHFMLEERESTQIQVLWDMMSLQLLNINHTQSTFLPQISNPVLSKKCQNPNTKSTFFFSSLPSPNFLHWLVLPIPVRHHIKSHSL